MRLLIFGSSGALGHALHVAAIRRGHSVIPVPRERADVTRLSEVYREVQEGDPDVVINATGILRGSNGPASEMVAVNALAPYYMAEACRASGARFLQISTDCVFSGQRVRRWNMLGDDPDPTDLYGRTKALAEVRADHVTVVRTSFLSRRSHLLKHIAEGPYPIPGWRNALWSGSTVEAVADVLVREIPGDDLWGRRIQHLATTEAVSKLDVINAILAHFDWSAVVEPVDKPRLNMALAPTIELPPFREALEVW